MSPLAVHAVLRDGCGASQGEHGCRRGATVPTLLSHVAGSQVSERHNTFPPLETCGLHHLH